MAVMINQTSFSADVSGVLDKDSKQYDLLVVSASFETAADGSIAVSENQAPVRGVDVCYGEPGLSSVRYEGETALDKPLVDVLINGSAYAPNGKKAKSVIVSARVGDVHKELRVIGDRYWLRGTLSLIPSAPKPFESMPIIYERSQGGTAKRRVDPWNPVGVGYRGARPQVGSVETELPNIEAFRSKSRTGQGPAKRAGFGVIARNWRPRVGFAGTYDKAWRKEQFPLLPKDFDNRFNQAAPSDQQSAVIQGGEPVEIQNMTPRGMLRFVLPRLDVPVRVRYSNRSGTVPLRLDTVLIEPDRLRLVLIARAKIANTASFGPLEEIVVGHCTNAWWYSRLRNKTYLDNNGLNGRKPFAQHFST